MILERLGDSAYIGRDLKIPPFAAARLLQAAQIPGLIEAVASYETIGLYVDPTAFHPVELDTVLSANAGDPPTARRHTIPVCYELGLDLENSAANLSMTTEDLIYHHTSADFQCFAVGFCPGFPYLGYVPPEISGLPRLPSPRTNIEPGSVGLTGRQTAVYPLPRPGGWPLIGKTPLTIVDEADGYFPIEAGDLIRFSRISDGEYKAMLGERL